MWSVFFVFLSYLDRNVVRSDFLSRALYAEKESKEMFSMLNGTFCAKMSIVGENFLYQVSNGAEVVSSVVSPAGKLVDCSVIVNEMQVKSFMHECRLGLKEKRGTRQLQTRFARMDEAKLMCRELKERSERSGRARDADSGESALQDKTLKRSKRGFTYPGTLWCGAGNMADTYDQLGEFAATDSCCRTHDHCPHVIHAFSSNYGYTNFKWHSVCHCDCDYALKDCLRKVNDTSSRVVGQAFFNVIGVPCFEFAYEERCAERHWYGMCKRYEKLPVAVLQDAVPYDFGGIDVIDELTLAPPKSKDSKKSSKEEKAESPTQSTMSGPEEPSLTNVVTAAEDFIKVLATVSTSQSSTTDSEKGEAQSSEKKKRKNKGKKKKPNKKQKGKGKGRKRKQKAETAAKLEEGAAVSPPGSKAEQVSALSNFISEVHRNEHPSRKTNSVDDSEYDLTGRDQPNEVMKDEQGTDKETVSIASPTADQKMLEESHSEVKTEGNTLSTNMTTVAPSRRQRKGRRREKSWKTLPPSSEELVANTRAVSVPSIITINPTAPPEPQNFSTGRTPIVILKVKRNRSKERGDTEGRKKRRKASSAVPIVSAALQNSSVDNVEVILLAGAPTAAPFIPTTERQLSHRPDVYGGTTKVTAVHSSFSVLKRQRSKERGLRNRRRKMESVPPVLTTPHISVPLNLPAVTEQTESHTEWRLFTTAAPTISTQHHRRRPRQQRKPRKKGAALGSELSVPKQTVTFTTTPANVATTRVLGSEKACVTTSAVPVLSPLQVSIEKAQAQFTRKKRRKAALFNRQE